MNTNVDSNKENPYAAKIFGVERHKIDLLWKSFLYRTLGIKMPKLRDQRGYWQNHGDFYMNLFLGSNNDDREKFFQDLLFAEIAKIEFDSIFEAGCGFGWNIRRAKEEYPEAFVGGLDFSFGQLKNSQRYAGGLSLPVTMGDNRKIPFADNSFDVGFSLGVYMNIHPDDIEAAAYELIRVCTKRIIHVEYDENHATDALREKRAAKRNVVSHDFADIYSRLGQRIDTVLTYRDFESQFAEFEAKIQSKHELWTPFEGASKYVITVIDVSGEA